MVCSLRALADKPYYDTLAGAGYVTAARGWETIRYAWGQRTRLQTTGAALVAVKRCRPLRMRMPAQDRRSAHELLYLAAVQNNR